MILGHESHLAGPAAWAPLIPVAVVLVGYLALAQQRSNEPRGWSAWRTASFVTGAGLLTLAVVPSLLPFAAGDLRRHMLQHLLLGMLAPLGLVLGAPITLTLRSVSVQHGARIGQVLRSRPARTLTNPVTALALNLGGLIAVYFTPLHGMTETSPLVHLLVHLHFLAAGALFAWVIAGPDPAPHRPSVPARLVVLGVAIAGHAIVAQLLYAGLYVHIDAPIEQLQGAGDLMYFGGDIAELLLALALVSTWRPQRRVRIAPHPAPSLS